MKVQPNYAPSVNVPTCPECGEPCCWDCGGCWDCGTEQCHPIAAMAEDDWKDPEEP